MVDNHENGPIDEPIDAGDDALGLDAPDGEGAAGAGVGTESMCVLEAALFASTEILSIGRLKAIMPGQPDARAIRKMVDTINEKLQCERHPFEIVELGGGYQFRTVPYYHPWVQQVFKEKAARRLSIQALECLAIIAYKQPITKAEIEAIRGVTSEGAMKTLLEKHLVTICGRSDKVGHPLLYGTTPTFLQYFGLNRISDLPKIEEFEAMAREKMDDLNDEELRKIEELAGQSSGEGDGSAEASDESEQGDQAEQERTGDGAGSENAAVDSQCDSDATADRSEPAPAATAPAGDDPVVEPAQSDESTGQREPQRAPATEMPSGAAPDSTEEKTDPRPAVGGANSDAPGDGGPDRAEPSHDDTQS
jgi:segregation and condensation protein B